MIFDSSSLEFLNHLDSSFELSLLFFEAIVAFSQIAEHARSPWLARNADMARITNAVGLSSLAICCFLLLILFLIRLVLTVN